MDQGPAGNYWKRAISRRRLIGASAVSVGSLAFLAACGSNSSSSATATPHAAATGAAGGATAAAASATAAAAAATPKAGGRVKWGELTDLIDPAAPYSLDPPYSNLQGAIWDTLFRYDTGDLKPTPRLAQSYEFNGDQSQIVVTLRPNLKFHDGSALDAAAIVASYNSISAKATPPSQLTKLGPAYVNQITATDPTHVTFKLNRPGMLIFDLFNFWTIADAKQIPQLAKGAVPNGSGPFKIASISPKVGAKLDKFADFYQPALLDGIDYKVYPSTAGMSLALQSGELDIAPSLGVDDVLRLKKGGLPFYSLAPSEATQVSFGMNANGAITKDKRIRQALYHAMNHEHIVQDVYTGESAPLYSLWPTTSPAFESRYKQSPFDIATSKKLLSAAGYSGETLDVYIAAGRPAQTNTFTVFQADAKTAGINLKSNVADASVWLPNWVKGKYPACYIAGFGFNGMHPDTLFVMNYQVRVPNSATFDSTAYDKFQSDIAKATTQAERTSLYQTFNKLWDDEMWVFLTEAAKVTQVTSKRVQGYELIPFSGALKFEKLGLA